MAVGQIDSVDDLRIGREHRQPGGSGAPKAEIFYFGSVVGSSESGTSDEEKGA
jgi:hypothetical protein